VTAGAGALGLVPWPEDARARADLLAPVVGDARVVAWSEGLHHTEEFLSLRNDAVAAMVEEFGVTVLAAETGFTEALAVADYLRGAGPEEPDPAALEGIWSWGGALEPNRELLIWLRRHNQRSARPVAFYGLDPCGAYRGRFQHARRGLDRAVAYVVAADRAAGEPLQARLAPLLDRFSTGGYPRLSIPERDRLAGAIAQLRTWFDRESDARLEDAGFRCARHQATLAGHLDLLLRGGGRGAHTARRDAAQAESFRFVLGEHRAADRILLFEQVDHLVDLPGTLGHHLRTMLPGQIRSIGSVWERAPDGNTSHRDNIAPVASLLAAAVDQLPVGQRTGRYFCDLAPLAGAGPASPTSPGLARYLASFEATLYVPDLTATGPGVRAVGG